MDQVTGKPLPGVELSLQPLHESAAPSPTPVAKGDEKETAPATSDETGHFFFGDLPSGRYRLVVRDQRYLEPPETILEPSSSIPEDAKPHCITLRGAAFISGRLVDEEGKAARQTEIVLFSAGPQSKEIARSKSDARTGKFIFSRLDPEPAYTLSLESPECLNWAQRQIIAGTSSLRIKTSKGSSLRLKAVDDAKGVLLTKFEVFVVPPDFPRDRPPSPAEAACMRHRGIEDASGLAEFEGLGRGQHGILVASEGYATSSFTAAISGEATQPLVVRLAPRECQRVRLVEKGTQAPIEGAIVATDAEVFQNPEARRLAPPVRSDSAGRLQFCPAFPSDRDFIIHHDHYAPMRVLLESGRASEEITVEMTAGGSIEGEVRDREGTPEPGVTIRAEQFGKPFEALTDSSAHYSLDHLPPVISQLTRESSSHGEAMSRSVRVEEGKTSRLDFGPAGSVSVKIVNDGLPVTHARVMVRSGSGKDIDVDWTRTDGDGRLRYKIYRSPIVAAIEQERCWVFLRLPNRGAPDAADTIPFPPRRFSGRLLDSSRKPLKDAALLVMSEGGGIERAAEGADGPRFWISSNGSTAETDENGRFELFIPITAVGINVTTGPGRIQLVEIPEGDSGEIVLVQRGRIRGTVRTLDGPAAANIGLTRPGWRTLSETHHAGASGTFEIQDTEEGTFTLIVWANELAPYVETRLEVTRGSDIDRDVLLTVGGRLRVVLSQPPSPLSLAAPGFLTVQEADIGWILAFAAPPEIRPSKEGVEAIFPHVPPGVYRVDCGKKPVEATIRGTEEVSVDCR